MTNEIPAPGSRRKASAWGIALLALGCWLILMVASDVSSTHALELLGGFALAVLGLYVAWRTVRVRDSISVSAPAVASDFTPAPMADELNQALCAITANADAIERLIGRQPPDVDEVRAALADIVHDAARASRTIQAAVPHHIDVAQLMDQMMQRLRGEMALHRVTCEVETAAHLPGIRGFHEQLLQLFTRLVSRVLGAMPGHERRERRLRVRASSQDRSVAISIEDAGAAIRPESAERLCDPSCRRIVHAHGGHIAVTRAAGGGAALQVILPASS